MVAGSVSLFMGFQAYFHQITPTDRTGCQALAVWTNKRVLFLSDNTAVVAVINRQTAKDPQFMSLLRQLIVACLSYNICFRDKHIPGKTNVVADLISRLQIARARTIQPSLDNQPTPVPIHWLPWHTTP